MDFLRESRVVPEYKFNIRHRGIPRADTKAQVASIRYIQHTPCNANDANPWNRFLDARKKAPACAGAFRYHEM